MTTGADNSNRQVACLSQRALPKIINFAAVKREKVEPSAYSFSIVDRMTAHSWTESAQQLGYTRLIFETAIPTEGSPGGEFLLVYARDCAWSSWGIGCDSDGFILWHAPRGTTIGRFRSMRDALDKIGEISLGI